MNANFELCRGLAPGTDQPGLGSGANYRPKVGNKEFPAHGSVVFDSDVPVVKTHIITNESPLPMRLTWHTENNANRKGKPILVPGTLNSRGRIKKASRVIRIAPFESKLFSVVVTRPDRTVEKPKIVIAIRKYEQYAAVLQYGVLRDRKQLTQRSCVTWNDATGYCDKCVHSVETDFGVRAAGTAPMQYACSNMEPNAPVRSTFKGFITMQGGEPAGAWMQLYLQSRSGTYVMEYRQPSNWVSVDGIVSDTVPVDGRVPNNLILTVCQYWGSPKNCVAQSDAKITVERLR